MNWYCKRLVLILALVMYGTSAIFATDDCEPCEEAEDPSLVQGGADPCKPRDEGTEVENEPCKECDGAGGIQNKEDGANCKVNGKNGVCCSGVCYEVPGEGEDPCDWANSNQSIFPQNQQQEVFGDPDCYGYVLCLNGEEYPCVIDAHVAAAHPSWGSEILGCMAGHEQKHMNQGVNCPPCGVAAGTGPSSQEEVDQLECEAFYKEWECLDALDELNIDGILGATERVMCAMHALNCTNIPSN